MAVSGLYYFNGLPIQKNIVEQLDQREWNPVSAAANSRATQQYGFIYDYKARKVGSACEPIPDFLENLRRQLTEKCRKESHEISDDYFNQCIVNNYMPSQGINMHTDHNVYGAIIGCFTLGSGATMTFRNGQDKQELYVEPDSLYIMTGDARYKWTHEMPARKSDMVDGTKHIRGRRVSVTFRHVPEK